MYHGLFCLKKDPHSRHILVLIDITACGWRTVRCHFKMSF